MNTTVITKPLSLNQYAQLIKQQQLSTVSKNSFILEKIINKIKQQPNK